MIVLAQQSATHTIWAWWNFSIWLSRQSLWFIKHNHSRSSYRIIKVFGVKCGLKQWLFCPSDLLRPKIGIFKFSLFALQNIFTLFSQDFSFKYDLNNLSFGLNHLPLLRTQIFKVALFCYQKAGPYPENFRGHRFLKW